MAKDKDNNSKLLSALLTLLLGGGIVAVLFHTSLNYKYPPEEALLQQLQDPIDVAEDEDFVEFEEMLAAADSEATEPGEPIEQDQPAEDNPPQEAGQNNLKNEGTLNEPPQPPVATKTKTNSPMEVKKETPKDTKPQKQTTSESAKPPKSKGDNKPPTTTPTNNQKPAGNTPPNAVENAFKKGNNGSTPGSTTDGKMSKPSIGGGLGGYTEASFPTAPCPGPGTVVMQVVVSSTGRVTKATVIGGSLRGNSRACDICRGLAMRSTFRVPKNTNVERTGTLTYTVK